MPEVAVVPVLAAAVVAFVLSGAYYAVLGDRLPAADPEPPPPWTYGLELVRCLVVAAVVAGLVVQTGTDDWTGGLALGVAPGWASRWCSSPAVSSTRRWRPGWPRSTPATGC